MRFHGLPAGKNLFTHEVPIECVNGCRQRWQEGGRGLPQRSVTSADYPWVNLRENDQKCSERKRSRDATVEQRSKVKERCLSADRLAGNLGGGVVINETFFGVTVLHAFFLTLCCLRAAAGGSLSRAYLSGRT